MAGLSDTARLLKELVAIESVNPVFGGSGEGELAAYLVSWLSRTGAEVSQQEVAPGRNNVVAVVRAGSGPAVLLDAHLDTVSADSWLEGNPFRPVVRDGRLYGRGSCDTKASMAIYLHLIGQFAADPSRLRCPLVFSATIDEEDRQSGAYRLLDHDFGVEIGAAIAGEPTQCRLIHAHKGLIRLRIEAEGTAAHASKPSRGDNAIAKMGRILIGLEALARQFEERPPHPLLGRPTLNPGTIRGGTAVNVVPDRCVLEVDRRLIPGETTPEALAEIEKIVAAEDRVTVIPHYDRPALETPATGELVQAFRSSIRSTGRDDTPTVADYLTNAVAFAARGVPALVFGPGDVAQAHTDHEYIELAEIEAATAILRHFLEN